jgi:hypothetical protein
LPPPPPLPPRPFLLLLLYHLTSSSNHTIKPVCLRDHRYKPTVFVLPPSYPLSVLLSTTIGGSLGASLPAAAIADDASTSSLSVATVTASAMAKPRPSLRPGLVLDSGGEDVDEPQGQGSAYPREPYQSAASLLAQPLPVVGLHPRGSTVGGSSAGMTMALANTRGSVVAAGIRPRTAGSAVAGTCTSCRASPGVGNGNSRHTQQNPRCRCMCTF